MLDPQIISENYTLSEIDAQIVTLKEVYNNAMKNRLYQLDDMHSRQRVEQHDIDKISNELNVWLNARSILTGNRETLLISPVYTGNRT